MKEKIIIVIGVALLVLTRIAFANTPLGIPQGMICDNLSDCRDVLAKDQAAATSDNATCDYVAHKDQAKIDADNKFINAQSNVTQ